MNESGRHELLWIRMGVFGGMWACVADPVVILVPLPLGMSAAVVVLRVASPTAVGCSDERNPPEPK